MNRFSRSGVIGAFMAFVVGAALLWVPAPAGAVDGGCQISTEAGFEISSCVSDDGIDVFADFYVNVVGPIGAGGCKVRITIVDVGVGDVAQGLDDLCTLGFHPPASRAKKIPGHAYRAVVRLEVFSQHHYFLSLDVH